MALAKRVSIFAEPVNTEGAQVEEKKPRTECRTPVVESNQVTSSRYRPQQNKVDGQRNEMLQVDTGKRGDLIASETRARKRHG